MNIFISLFYRMYSLLIRVKIKLFIVREILTMNTGYNRWILKNEAANLENSKPSFEYMPLISIIIPVYNVKELYLRECIESVLHQTYTNWELCIADDNSTEPYIRQVLEEYNEIDERINICYRQENGHISACSNSAFELVKGEFTALLDNDDVLAPFALSEVVRKINENINVNLIYSNEDKLWNGKRCFPFFKRKYNTNLLRHINYICHFAVYRTSFIRKVEGFRVGYEGVQDWDLALRITELTESVEHIPVILYHWRISETSTSGGEHNKSYIKSARKKLLGIKNID